METNHRLDARPLPMPEAREISKRGKRLPATWLLMLLLLPVVVVLASSIGPVSVPFRHTLAMLLELVHLTDKGGFGEREWVVVTQVRLPRVLVGALVGAALAVSGAVMQGLFRNPLVEPGYVGVSSGAAFGAVCALFFGWTRISPWALPGAAFIGGLAAILLVLAVWKMSKASGAAVLLLLGVGISAFLSALISVMMAGSSSEQELRSIVYWLQGGLEARTWQHVQLVGPIVAAACLLLCSFGRELNVMLLGDDLAQTAGIRVAATRLVLLGLTSLATGAAVAVSGTIGFVGLIVPHIVRLLCGPDHRVLLPLAALGGAVFLMLADLVSRIVLQPVSLQVGVVCAIVGAPLFVILVLRSRKGGHLA
ncbi:FecCD family ABC transporter permease [Paenibacillus ginsengihumi]|uniref:FecCD family ABC transporter permease n=1 Tax=Paenibacillus ginsengihumi TaxID=431596 RepID=UPI000371EE3B|nr:iron ABC transporter permease [Paenibacillus ginsengihumi]